MIHLPHVDSGKFIFISFYTNNYINRCCYRIDLVDSSIFKADVITVPLI